MARLVSGLNIAEALKESAHVRMFVDLDFVSGPVYLHDGIGDLTALGRTYLGAGQLGSIEAIAEQGDYVARAVKLKLSGVPGDFVTQAMTENYQNRDAIIYVGFVSETTGQVLANPEAVWKGKMSTMAASGSINEAEFTLTCEHRVRRFARIARYTDADQQLAYPGDKFFEFVIRIPGFKTQWGGKGYGGAFLGSNTNIGGQPPIYGGGGGSGGGSGPPPVWNLP